jgi:hypothetical protein
MNKICVIYTKATGVHQPFEKVYKKNLFGFARMMSISWIISIRTKEDQYKIEKEEHYIIKPRCMVIPDNLEITNKKANEIGTEIDIVLDKFKEDMKDRSIKLIISQDLDFHLRTLQAELIRYNKAIDFNKYLLIDINNLIDKKYNLDELCVMYLNIQNEKQCNNICELFFKLYNNYEKKVLEN